MRLADNAGEWVEAFGQEELRARLLTALPNLRAELIEAEHVHAMLSVLARAVSAAVRPDDEERGSAILGVVASLLEEPNLHPELANAIGLSFVDPVQLQKTEAGRRLWSRTPHLLRRQLAATDVSE